ncbi:hypothetical protein OOK39_45845 [Streptomyces sp. NBC_00264]|uniref:hypothetical protein n=1 Tax=unclassified Streptomyces TaxID=2593676 RepID=UPI00224FC6CA|nr:MULTISPECIES: hypothetical protein [unclassified Streptomyces]MCX5166347.1 hypothetical protein [Streptomyces sp. NBC_00305]MCX5224864.1 hypothetical protein [Streptomyces sp. NBC_00264]
MPEEYLEVRTTDPATWMPTPENLERLAAFTRVAAARRRAIEDGETPAPAADPAGPVDRHRQEHEQQHQQSGAGRRYRMGGPFRGLAARSRGGTGVPPTYAEAVRAGARGRSI